jgi:hypothetical protein
MQSTCTQSVICVAFDIYLSFALTCCSPDKHVDKSTLISATSTAFSFVLLKADLGTLKYVTAIGTKGRFPQLNKLGYPISTPEWVKKYRLFYRISSSAEWIAIGKSDLF